MAEIKRTPDGLEIPPPGPEDVLYEKCEGYARIVLNRPTALNALNKNSQRLLYAAIQRAIEDDEVRAIILTGAGRSFSAGGDLYGSLYPDDAPAPSGFEVQMAIWSCPKPVIAAVRGHAVGQACELAGVCDITVAAEDAKFGEIQIRNGSSPPVLIMPFLVGLKSAKELLLLGEVVDAREAQRLGLVNRVVPAERLDEEAESLARKLAALPQAAVRMNKIIVNRAYELSGFREALAYRDDPNVAALTQSAQDDPLAKERRRVMTEVGWNKFREERDTLYGGSS